MSITLEKKNVHPYVVSVKGVCGGKPIIQGTRVPVWSIVKWYKLDMSIEEILREFPQLTPAQIHDAFSYYYDHQKIIEKEISENENESYWKKVTQQVTKKHP